MGGLVFSRGHPFGVFFSCLVCFEISMKSSIKASSYFKSIFPVKESLKRDLSPSHIKLPFYTFRNI